MTVLRTLTREHTTTVPLRIDSIADDQASTTPTLYCTDVEGTKARVTVRKPPASDISFEPSEWYRFEGVARTASLKTGLFALSEGGDAKRISAPERQTHPPLTELETPWLVQSGATTERIAVTVQPRPTESVDDIDVEEPETFEIGAVCFTRCDGASEATVYHREESATEDEHLLLEHVVEYLSEVAGATLVTRGGDRSPLAMLSQRLEMASTGDIVATGAEQVLTECFRASVRRIAARAAANTLDEAARQLGVDNSPTLLSDYDIGLSPADWREGERDSMALSDVSDPRMTDRDYAVLIEQYLGTEADSVDPAQLGECLKAYASADLSLLCGLSTHGVMERLGCPRLSDRLLT